MPKEALTIGLAGVLPYMVTSLSTVYLAYDINHAQAHGSGLLMDPNTAEVLLHIIEPLQIGYGAVVCLNALAPAHAMAPNILRSSPFSVPFIGDWSGQSMAAAMATGVTHTELSHQLSHGLQHFSQLNTL